MSLRQTRSIRPKTADEQHDDPAQALDVVIVGAHGGAGTSTLAALLPAAWDLGAIGPQRELERSPLNARGRPIVLAVRNTALAAKSAVAAISALHGWFEEIAALAIVSDGGPETPSATARFALLERRVGGIVRVPYVRGLRLAEDPTDVPLPRKAQQALNELRILLGVLEPVGGRSR